MEAQKKVLIVDDEKFVTDALEGFLHPRGYEVFKAEDGQLCLDIIKNQAPDLVLLDIRLPKVDGIEILRLLRSDYSNIKVIVMTAYDREYKDAVDGIGCDFFFIKPLLIDDLLDKVEELLSESGTTERMAIGTTQKMPQKTEYVTPEESLPKARLLIVSPRGLISGLLKDYFMRKDLCNGVYEVLESGLEQSEYIRKFQPDIIILDVALVGLLGEFGLTLIKMPNPPKEIILFGDPAVKWEEAEVLIKRGTKFIEMPMEFHHDSLLFQETLQRLNAAVKEVCLKYFLVAKEVD